MNRRLKPAVPDTTPKGDEELLEQALKILRPKPDEIEDARQAIIGIAEKFNSDLHQDRLAPRASQVVAEIKRTKIKVAQLRKSISKLSPYAKSAIRGGAAELAEQELMSADDILRGACDPGLERMELVMDMACGHVASAIGSGDPARPDKGGRTNARRADKGHPKWLLSLGCWQLLEKHRSGASTGYRDGFLLQLTDIVFTYATGRTNSDGEGLSEWTQRVVYAMPLIKAFSDLANELKAAIFADNNALDLAATDAEYDRIEASRFCKELDLREIEEFTLPRLWAGNHTVIDALRPRRSRGPKARARDARSRFDATLGRN